MQARGTLPVLLHFLAYWFHGCSSLEGDVLLHVQFDVGNRSQNMPCGLPDAQNSAGIGLDSKTRCLGKNGRMGKLGGIEGLPDIRRQAFFIYLENYSWRRNLDNI